MSFFPCQMYSFSVFHLINASTQSRKYTPSFIRDTIKHPGIKPFQNIIHLPGQVFGSLFVWLKITCILLYYWGSASSWGWHLFPPSGYPVCRKQTTSVRFADVKLLWRHVRSCKAMHGVACSWPSSWRNTSTHVVPVLNAVCQRLVPSPTFSQRYSII